MAINLRRIIPRALRPLWNRATTPWKAIMVAFLIGSALAFFFVVDVVHDVLKDKLEGLIFDWLAISIKGETGREIAKWFVGKLVNYPSVTLLALFLILLLLLVATSWVQVAIWGDIPENPRGHSTAYPTSTEAPAEPEVNSFSNYLLNLAGRDSRNMSALIHPDWDGVTTDAHLDAPEPYINLKVGFVNATLFEIAADQIRGRIHYLRSPLQRAPEIVERVIIPHGQRREVVITQWLLPETAHQMARSLPVALQTGQMAISFVYLHDEAKPKEIAVAFPEEIFKIAAPPTDPNLPLWQSVYVSEITLSFGRLLTENIIDFDIVAFNGSGGSISIRRRAEGVLRIHWVEIENQNQPKQDWLLTLQPQIVEAESILDHISHCSEFRIRLAQPVGGKQIDIWAAYCNYKDINVDLRSVRLWAHRDGDERYSDQLALWDALVCCKVKDGSDRVFSVRQKIPATKS